MFFTPRKAEKVRSDKKIKVLPALDRDTHDKLVKLAISCGMTKTKLAGELIKIAVNHADIINHYQQRYNKDEQYRIIIKHHNGKVYY